MSIGRRGLLALGGLTALVPPLVSCSAAQDAQKVASYFRDRPHVRSVVDSYETSDADERVRIDLELDDDVSADDIAALFADAEPALHERAWFPVDVSASWSHLGIRMENCVQAIFNSPSTPNSYDGALVRASVEGALMLATETALTVEYLGAGDAGDGGIPALSYTVDHGSGDALPGDVVLSLSRDPTPDGYDVVLGQTMVLAGWRVTVGATSQEGEVSAEGVPIAELVAALPSPTGYASMSAGHIATLPEGAALGLVAEVPGPEEFVSLGAVAVRVLEEAGWHGAFEVCGTGPGRVQVVALDTTAPTTAVLSESEPGLGVQVLEQARA